MCSFTYYNDCDRLSRPESLQSCPYRQSWAVTAWVVLTDIQLIYESLKNIQLFYYSKLDSICVFSIEGRVQTLAIEMFGEISYKYLRISE